MNKSPVAAAVFSLQAQSLVLKHIPMANNNKISAENVLLKTKIIKDAIWILVFYNTMHMLTKLIAISNISFNTSVSVTVTSSGQGQETCGSLMKGQ